ncbi:MAG: hypothetical protein LBO77_03780 [Desulfovibrio sp.]|nr:hypothetical protein [Desulfovibrio sp.]
MTETSKELRGGGSFCDFSGPEILRLTFFEIPLKLESMKIASEEIRSLVVKAYLSGTAGRKKLSEISGYTLASVSNWIRAYERENRLSPRPRGHRSSVFSQEEVDQLVELLQNNAGITLADIKEHFHKQCSLVTIHKLVGKLGFDVARNSEGKRIRVRKYNPKSEDGARYSGDGQAE